MKNSLSWKSIIILCGVFLWLALRRDQVPHTGFGSGSVDFQFIIYSLLAIAGNLMVYYFRYKTGFGVGDGVYGSVSSRHPPVPVGDWYLFQLGGTDFLVGDVEKTVVVPKGCTRKRGKCWFWDCKFEPVDYTYLPPFMREHLRDGKFNLDKVYIGVTPREYEIYFPTLAKLRSLFFEGNRLGNTLRDLGRSRREVLEDDISSARRVIEDSTKGKSMLSRLFGRISSGEEDVDDE